MKRESCVDDVGAHLSDEEGELVAGRVQVVGQDGAVDGEQRFLTRKTDGESREVTLKFLMKSFNFYLQ